MASPSGMDSDKLFKLYLYDYMLQKGRHRAAAIFKEEANLDVDIPIMNGFLNDWWSIFNDMFCARHLQGQECREHAFSLPLTSEQGQLSETGLMKQPVACLSPSEVYDIQKPHPSLQLANVNSLQFSEGSSSNPIVSEIEKELQMLAKINTTEQEDRRDQPQQLISGFSFQELRCFHSSRSEVLSCDFSSEGKLLASAGQEKKIFIWDMETFNCVTTSEDHANLITDVRFQPGSTVFATSSFDKTVHIWDAAKPNKSSFQLSGFFQQVMSVDFHPTRKNLFCTCDMSNTIQMWNTDEIVCTNTAKGGSKQVRFQPGSGKLLAAATRNIVNIFDVETSQVTLQLNGHVKDVLSICWDTSGSHLISVSQDSARVWTPKSQKKEAYELYSNGNSFQSGIFGPEYSPASVIIGGYQTLELWYPSVSCQTMAISAHKGLIPGLAYSPRHGMIASASHDGCVKLWR